MPFSKPPALPVRLEKAMPFLLHFHLRKAPVQQMASSKALPVDIFGLVVIVLARLA